jgi:RNA polymerase sigma-70 factor (ECF subfamily)
LADDQWGDRMRAALAGDEAQYRALLVELVVALRRIVRAALARAGRSSADSEDIVQEVLLTIHLKRGTWDTERPFAPWLHVVTRHKVIDALRRQGHRVEVPIDDVVDWLAAPAVPETDGVGIDRLIGRLGAREQTIVRMASLDGRPSQEIAGRLGMTEGAVRVALHRALRRLSAMYKEELT